MKKKIFISVLSGFILLLVAFGFLLKGLGKSDLKIESRASSGIAVVELFTSEGCSSCPPADQLLSDLKNQNNPQIFLLAFHVDYWNYLGWKDPFSDAKYSARQSEYASTLYYDVYTPQMIVNGKKVFVGSNRPEANDAIKDALNHPASLQIKFESDYNKQRKTLAVKYALDGDLKDQVLNIALIENDATNNVSRGENSGKTLHHVNVVRNFKSVPLSNTSAEVSVHLPDDLAPKNTSLILYSQNEKTKEVTGAAVGIVSEM